MHRRTPATTERRLMNVAIVNCHVESGPDPKQCTERAGRSFREVLSDARRSHFRDEQAFC